MTKRSLAIGAWLLCAGPLLAQSSTWVAVSGGSWSNGSNWSGGVAPVSGPTTDLIFPMTIDPYGTTNDNPGTFILHTITIGNDTRTASAVGGNPIQFAGANPGFIITGARTTNFLPTSIDLTGPTSITGTAGSGKFSITRPITGGGSLIINRPTTNFVGWNELSSTTANSFAGGVTLQSGILMVSQGANVGTGAITIATTGTGFDATGDLRASAEVTFNVPVNVNSGATLNYRIGSQLNFGQPINGAGGFSAGSALGASPLAMEGNNGFTGRTDLTGATLTLRGTTGALTGTTLIEAAGSVIALNSNAATTGSGNSAGNHVGQNRIRDDAVLNFHRATLDLIANTSASTSEALGTLNGSGGNVFRLTPQTNTGASLTIDNLVRTNRGTFEFRAANLGTAAPGTANSSNILLNQINGLSPAASLVGGGGAPGSTNISIIPFASGSPAAGSFGSTFVTYGANGLRNLDAATEFAPSLQEVPYAPGATNNVRLATPQVVASQPVTANSLLIAANTAGVYGFGGLTGRVNVTSGALMGAANPIISGVAEVDFGGSEAVTTNGMFVQSALRNANGLTVSGGAAGPSLLSPNNSIAGTISLNSGVITINNQAQLGGASALNLNGGTLIVTVLATGAPEVLSLPMSVSPGGARMSFSAFGGLSTASHVALTGSLSGSGSVNLLFSTGTLTLSGDNSAFSGPLVVNSGFVQFDSPARLGTNSSITLGAMATFSTPGVLHPTASMSLNKNIYLDGFGDVRVDAGTTVTLNGFITGLNSFSSDQFQKMGAGELILTREATHFGGTVLGDRSGARLNVGGTLTLRDQGAILNTGSAVGFPPTEFVVNGGSTLVVDNTGSANLANRLSLATMELGGGALVLKGSASASSSEITGQLVTAANTGSIVEVIPGAGQTAAMFFNGGLVVNAGSTLIVRSPGLGGTTPGTGQINFIPAISMTNGILAGVFGEDSGPTPAVGFVRVDTIPATATFPEQSRSRLLTAAEYALNSFPDSGVVPTNHRQTLPAAPTGSPQVNSLYLDVGGSLAIGAGNTVRLTSGNLLMANGTSVTGSAGFLTSNNHLHIYVPTGGTATLGANVSGGQIVAKTGAGTLELTTAISGATAPTQYNVQRGALRLGVGGSIPATSVVRVEAGATFDVNAAGGIFDLASLNGLGTIQLGTNPATVLRISPGAGVTSLFGGTIAGSGSLEKAGAGILQLAQTANYTGPITLSAGTLRFGGDVVASPAIPVISGGTITAADGTTIFARNVRDFQRSIDVNQGAAAGSLTLSTEAGGLMKVSGGINLGTNKTLVVGASTNGMIRFSGPITGNGNVDFSMGTGSNATRAIIDGNSTYAGTTTIGTAGLIGVGSDTAFGNGGTVSITNPASMVAVGNHRTISNPVNLNADLTYGSNDAIYQGFNLTFSGPTTMNASRTISTTAAGRLTLTNVSGPGFDLIKAGGGSLALAGANNTYSGATNVNAGSFLVNGTLAAGGGAVTVAPGAWLGGTGTINRTVTINSGGVMSPGISPGRLTVGGNVTMSSGSKYFWEMSSNTTAGGGTNWDQLTMTSGDLSVVGGAIFIPAFIGSATSPNIGDVFWQSTQRWDSIIDLTGTATNLSGLTAFTIDNSAWTAFGTFSTIPAVAGNGIALLWTPVPEPMHVLAVCALAAGAGQYWRRRRHDASLSSG